jgi:hypothetical protein
MKSVLSNTLVALVLCCSQGAFAWDGVVRAKVATVDVVGSAGGAPSNYDLRLSLEGGPTMCGASTPNWAYANISDVNYRAMVALMLTAQSTGKSVEVYSYRDAAGYCRVGYIKVIS